MATLHSFPLSVKIHHVLNDFGTVEIYEDGDFFYSYRIELLINGLPLLAPLSLKSYQNNEPGTIEFTQLCNYCVLVQWLDDAIDGKPWCFTEIEPPHFEMELSDMPLVLGNPLAINDWLNKKTGSIGLNTFIAPSADEDSTHTHFLQIEINPNFFMQSPVYKYSCCYGGGPLNFFIPTNLAALQTFRDELQNEYSRFETFVHQMKHTAKNGNLPEWVLRYGLEED